MKKTFHAEDLIIKDRVKEEIILNKQIDIKNIKNLDKQLIEVWKENSLVAEQRKKIRQAEVNNIVKHKGW